MTSEDKTSQRICRHMNEDHPSSVYAMILSTLTTTQELNWKIDNCQMTSISLSQIHLSFVCCDGDSCSKKETVVKFDPPLTSASEYRPRIVELHHQHITPKWSWLLTDPMIRMIVPTCLLLGYITHFISMDELDLLVNKVSWVQTIVMAIFQSIGTLYTAIQISWYFAIVAHFLEGVYVAYQCRSVLKLRVVSSLQWFGFVCLTGYPVTKRLLKFVALQNEAIAKQA